VVKLDVVYDRDLRQVMHKLRALIKIRGVVFVAFDNEIVAVSDTKADAKILRDAAYQKGWLQIALVHHPGGDTSRGSLAMRAGNHQRTAPANEFLFYDFGLRAIDEFAVESRFQFWVAAGNGRLPTITQSGAGSRCSDL